MPLDGHSFLVSQGWAGKGAGLRQGAITRPITVAQKNNLGGLGKDRDEAFPFWDHLFTAASKAITLKIHDSDDSDSDTTGPAASTLKRTSTGILSNRRPVDLPSTSTSGTCTPEPSSSTGPRLSLLAHAKREAAKRHLYSKFYRGLVLAPDTKSAQEPPNTPGTSIKTMAAVETTSDPSPFVVESIENKKKRKRKTETEEENSERQERKRLKKEKRAKKELKAKEKMERKELKAKAKSEKRARKEKKEEKRRNGEKGSGKTEIFDAEETDSERRERKRHRKEQVRSGLISGAVGDLSIRQKNPGATEDGSLPKKIKKKCKDAA
ncbi:hypothetical protein VKT23_003904 [Stygiomarasmius scandens]|uniref:G-patch domain-containing protein n=1 Tax=Marasmiellus scandens TaxID=2682957 RepID=A0ABR1JQM1_9AGAR